MLIRKLVHDCDVRISFMAVGFFTNLLAYLPEKHWDWNFSVIKSGHSNGIEDFCMELEEIIDYCQDYLLEANTCLNHYSLGYFIKLLKLSADKRLIQIWSLWAIFNLYQTKYARGFYVKENVKLYEILNQMKLSESTDLKVKDLCIYGLELLEKSGFKS